MRGAKILFIIHTCGLLLLLLAAAMVVPAIVDYVSGNHDWDTFLLSALVTSFTGGNWVFMSRGRQPELDQRSGYLLTVAAWLVVGGFGSLPLAFSSLHLSITDAVFETMSGLTTTGSTVLSGLDTMAPGLLLWRSLLQWVGGLGIVVMALVILPMLRIGGMQLFRTESSDISGKPVARAGQMAKLTTLIYVGLSLLCAIGYRIAGMGTFDAINHAMATIATGGFSTHDASLGFYNSLPIEIVAIIFMCAGALPLFWYVHVLVRPRGTSLADRQILGLFAVLIVGAGMLTAWNVAVNSMSVGHAARVAAVNAASVLTDTGFATTDFSTWGSFAIGIFFLLFFIGGCAGSTAGAIKIFRWQLLFKGMRRQLILTFSPNRALPQQYDGRKVDAEMMLSVRNFFFLYLMTFFLLTLGVTATGLDFLSSASGVAQAMANAGPGLGPIVGPGTTFALVPDAGKWLLVAGMLLGRLELLTVYVLLMPTYWRS